MRRREVVQLVEMVLMVRIADGLISIWANNHVNQATPSIRLYRYRTAPVINKFKADKRAGSMGLACVRYKWVESIPANGRNHRNDPNEPNR